MSEHQHNDPEPQGSEAAVVGCDDGAGRGQAEDDGLRRRLDDDDDPTTSPDADETTVVSNSKLQRNGPTSPKPLADCPVPEPRCAGSLPVPEEGGGAADDDVDRDQERRRGDGGMDDVIDDDDGKVDPEDLEEGEIDDEDDEAGAKDSEQATSRGSGAKKKSKKDRHQRKEAKGGGGGGGQGGRGEVVDDVDDARPRGPEGEEVEEDENDEEDEESFLGRTASRRGRKRKSEKELRKELEDDEAKKRAIKEKILQLEKQMAAGNEYDDVDDDDDDDDYYEGRGRGGGGGRGGGVGDDDGYGRQRDRHRGRHRRNDDDDIDDDLMDDEDDDDEAGLVDVDLPRRRGRDAADHQRRPPRSLLDHLPAGGGGGPRSGGGRMMLPHIYGGHQGPPPMGGPGGGGGDMSGMGGRKAEICRQFLQGRCRRNPCHYSHNVDAPKIMELCKFYLLERCAKKEKCLYLHKGFPCKYFHTGHKCPDTAESCKFSHDPLTDVTRGILLKHLETAPKEILGDFPRLTREAAAALVYATEAKSKGWLTGGRDTISASNASSGGRDEEVEPTEESVQNRLAKLNASSKARSAGDSFVEVAKMQTSSHQRQLLASSGIDPDSGISGPVAQSQPDRNARGGPTRPDARGGGPPMGVLLDGNNGRKGSRWDGNDGMDVDRFPPSSASSYPPHPLQIAGPGMYRGPRGPQPLPNPGAGLLGPAPGGGNLPNSDMYGYGRGGFRKPPIPPLLPPPPPGGGRGDEGGRQPFFPHHHHHQGHPPPPPAGLRRGRNNRSLEEHEDHQDGRNWDAEFDETCDDDSLKRAEVRRRALKRKRSRMDDENEEEGHYDYYEDEYQEEGHHRQRQDRKSHSSHKASRNSNRSNRELTPVPDGDEEELDFDYDYENKRKQASSKRARNHKVSRDDDPSGKRDPLHDVGHDEDDDDVSSPAAVADGSAVTQNRAFQKLQQKQKEKKASLDGVKETNPMFKEDNWHSSDDNNDGVDYDIGDHHHRHHPSAAADDGQNKRHPARTACLLDESDAHHDGSKAGSKMSELSHHQAGSSNNLLLGSSLPKELTQVLSSITKNLSPLDTVVALSAAEPSKDVISRNFRDPRQSRTHDHPQKIANDRGPAAASGNQYGAADAAERERDKRILESLSLFGELDLPPFKEDEGPQSPENEMDRVPGFPFKPHSVPMVAREIDASIVSHPPLEYKLRPLMTSKPDYSDVIERQNIPASKMQQDPRLRRYLGRKPAAPGSNAASRANHHEQQPPPPPRSSSSLSLPPYPAGVGDPRPAGDFPGNNRGRVDDEDDDEPTNVYNPLKDLYPKNHHHHQEHKSPPPPSFYQMPTNRGGGGGDAAGDTNSSSRSRDVYSPSQDVQDLYNNIEGHNRASSVYNPMRDLGGRPITTRPEPDGTYYGGAAAAAGDAPEAATTGRNHEYFGGPPPAPTPSMPPDLGFYSDTTTFGYAPPPPAGAPSAPGSNASSLLPSGFKNSSDPRQNRRDPRRRDF